MNEKQTTDDADSSLDEQLERFLYENCPGKLPDDYEIPGALMLLIVQFVKTITAADDADSSLEGDARRFYDRELNIDSCLTSVQLMARFAKTIAAEKDAEILRLTKILDEAAVRLNVRQKQSDEDGYTISRQKARIAELEAKLAAAEAENKTLSDDVAGYKDMYLDLKRKYGT